MHCCVEVTESSTNKQHQHRVFGGEEEGGSVRSGPGEARTILLFDTISARPSKQPRMVGSTLGVYSFALIFVSARTNKRHHHQVQAPAVGSLNILMIQPFVHSVRTRYHLTSRSPRLFNEFAMEALKFGPSCDVTGSFILSDRYRGVTVPSCEIKRRGFSVTKGFCSR
jgi:hypothetical protein